MSARIVTIDGGNGVGKTSLVSALKKRYAARGHAVQEISTGNLYRTLGWLAYEHAGRSLEHAAQVPAGTIIGLAREAELKLSGGLALVKGHPMDLALLRTQAMTVLVPQIAAQPELREFVEGLQHEAAARFDGLILADGRDTGTAVFPDAAVKIFLTVDDEEAARRQNEPVEMIRLRNKRDRERAAGPLRCPEGATVIDTTSIEFEEKVKRAAEAIEVRYPELGSQR